MGKASIILSALLAVASGPNLAIAEETRLIAGRSLPEYNPVGRLTARDLYTEGGCTGTLVSPDLVLTAAHCVVGEHADPDLLPDLKFAPGWGDGEAIEIRTARAVYLHPDYAPKAPSGANIAFDIALVRLDQPVTQVPPIRLGDRPSGALDLQLAGYPNRTNQALTLSDGCAHFAPHPDVIYFGCPVISGHSGGAVLARDDDGLYQVGVISSRTSGGGYAPAIGPWVRDFLADE